LRAGCRSRDFGHRGPIPDFGRAVACAGEPKKRNPHQRDAKSAATRGANLFSRQTRFSPHSPVVWSARGLPVDAG
jgi:hypothetical protein